MVVSRSRPPSQALGVAEALGAEAGKPYFKQLSAFVAAQRRKGPVYPPSEHVFAALDACPLSAVRVVIVGQDPYHGPGQAHGLAFSIADTSRCKFPPSLRNIFHECHSDPAVEFARGVACASGSRGSLGAWASQGVLLLNAVLTVDGGKPNSHQKKGWEQFTDAVVRAVLRRPGKGCVFLLWGLPAAKKVPAIDKAFHRVITSSHPSPLSNGKGNEPFTGSRCFSRCNALLAELGHEPIDWNV
jgi:uracil-DNA glycosylase